MIAFVIPFCHAPFVIPFLAIPFLAIPIHSHSCHSEGISPMEWNRNYAN